MRGQSAVYSKLRTVPSAFGAHVLQDAGSYQFQCVDGRDLLLAFSWTERYGAATIPALQREWALRGIANPRAGSYWCGPTLPIRKRHRSTSARGRPGWSMTRRTCRLGQCLEIVDKGVTNPTHSSSTCCDARASARPRCPERAERVRARHSCRQCRAGTIVHPNTGCDTAEQLPDARGTIRWGAVRVRCGGDGYTATVEGQVGHQGGCTPVKRAKPILVHGHMWTVHSLCFVSSRWTAASRRESAAQTPLHFFSQR